MALTDDEFERANQRAKASKAKRPTACDARYDRARDMVVIAFSNGAEFAFPPATAQGLEGATPAQLKDIEISPAGVGLHFPKLDADLYIPALLEGAMGTRKWMAAQLGAKGGAARSREKSAASRENGKLGGRPRKTRA